MLKGAQKSTTTTTGVYFDPAKAKARKKKRARDF
jgi:hypothetical protein